MFKKTNFQFSNFSFLVILLKKACNSASRNNLRQEGYSGHRSRTAPKYVYDLPYFERKEICRILDENNQYEALGGGLMCFSPSELSEFGRALYRGASPTDALLTTWGSQNHTILELFTLLGRLEHYRGMKVIQHLVESKYHAFIKEPALEAPSDLIELDLQGFPKSKQVHDNTGGTGKVEDKNANVVLDDPKPMIPESVGVLPQILYTDLQSATDNWDRRHIIGKGGFGTVYRGNWKNTPVAIKRMEQRANQTFLQSQQRQSLGELKFLNSCRHDNILPLYGYCFEGEHPCLVYQYMANGSLEDRLLCRNKSYPLNWTCRYNIARSVACGIQFLHSIGPQPLIHGDIKSANILLDKNFEAKVGDFGLAREMSAVGADGGASYIKVSRVHGTRPYLPDEYLRSKKLSTKVDTFSFGIMCYEILAGQRAYDETRPKKLLRDLFDDTENLESLKDPKGGSENPDIFWILLRTAKSCTQRLPKERPEMVQVLKTFDELLTQASIRTTNSHMTGFPQLFDQSQSLRPGSLFPSGHSANPRLSPIPFDFRGYRPQLFPASQGSMNHTPPKLLEPAPAQSFRFSPVFQDSVKHEGLGVPSEAGSLPRSSPLPVPSASASLQDDQYFPAFLDDRDEVGFEMTEEPSTVIPLITKLGIKD